MSVRALREAGGERRGLTEVAPELDHADARVRLLDASQNLERSVRAAVVDEQDLVRTSPALERVGELAVKRLEIVRLVVDRDDDGEVRASRCAPILISDALAALAPAPTSR